MDRDTDRDTDREMDRDRDFIFFPQISFTLLPGFGTF
jgi:hypothetical protein